MSTTKNDPVVEIIPQVDGLGANYAGDDSINYKLGPKIPLDTVQLNIHEGNSASKTGRIDAEIKTLARNLYLQGAFTPNEDTLNTLSREVSEFLRMTQVADNRYLGALIGCLIFGFAAKFTWGTFFLIIPCAIVGLFLGHFVGQKATSIKNHDSQVTEMYLLECKMEGLLRWLHVKHKEQSFHDLRVIIEIILSEFKPAFLYNEAPKATLVKFHDFLSRLAAELRYKNCLDALMLSCLMAKIYYKEWIEGKQPESRNKTRFMTKVKDVLLTYKLLVEYSDMKQEKRFRLDANDINISYERKIYDKIKRFIAKPEIHEYLNQEPDVFMSQDRRDIFMAYLQERVVLPCPVSDLILPARQYDLHPQTSNRNYRITPYYIHPFTFNNIVFTENSVKYIYDTTVFVELLPDDPEAQSMAGAGRNHTHLLVDNEDHPAIIPISMGNSFHSHQSVPIEGVASLQIQKYHGKFGEDDKEEDRVSAAATPKSYNRSSLVDIFHQQCHAEDKENLYSKRPSHVANKKEQPEMVLQACQPEIIKGKSYVNSPAMARESHRKEHRPSVHAVPLEEAAPEVVVEAVLSPKRKQMAKLAQLRPDVRENFLKLMSIYEEDSSGWDHVHNSEWMNIFKTKVETSPVILIKAYSTLRGIPPAKVFKAIFDRDTRAKWETVLSDYKVLDKIDDYTDIIYSAFKAPIGISDRDFLQIRTCLQNFPDENSFVIHLKSCTHPKMPELKNRVRADTVISGYVIRPCREDPNSTELTTIAQTDPKGSIPTYIVNMFAAKAPKEWVVNLAKACKNL